jgi:mycothiol system anti-sigma-R factor
MNGDLDQVSSGAAGDDTEVDVDCSSAIHQLYDYLDGELTEKRRTQIAEHLDYCAPCANAAGFESELRQVIADKCKDHVPESLIERVAHLIEVEQRQPAAADPERTGPA